jgi:hypothetical protein
MGRVNTDTVTLKGCIRVGKLIIGDKIKQTFRSVSFLKTFLIMYRCSFLAAASQARKVPSFLCCLSFYFPSIFDNITEDF